MIERPVIEQIFGNKALNLGGPNPITADIPMGGGEGWLGLLLEFIYTIVIGTGTTAISEGELGIIRNITFKTDVDGESHILTGRAAYRYNHFIEILPSNKDAIAAASADYRVTVPILFADMMSGNPYETILDTGRYKSCELNPSMGSIADLLGTPGTATVTAKLNCSVIKTKERLLDWQKPVAYPYIKSLGQTDYTGLLRNLERSPDLRMRRLFWMLTTASTAGVPFSGTPADDSIKNVSIEHQAGYEYKKVIRQQLADEFAKHFGVTRPAGWYGFDFMKDGDLSNAFLTDPDFVSKLQLTWETDSGTAAMVNTLLDGVRALKPIREV